MKEGRLLSVQQRGGGHLPDSGGRGSIIIGGRILVAYSTDSTSDLLVRGAPAVKLSHSHRCD